MTLFSASLAAITSMAQTQPGLLITSPATGTIVNPGQSISVTVTSPAGLGFSQVDVMGEQPIGVSTTIATALPFQFTVNIPSAIRCGPRALTAEGTTTSGQNVDSASIMIDVERPDPPTGISTDSSLTFDSQGEQTRLMVDGGFYDSATNSNLTLDVSESTFVSFSSSNTAVATVNPSGIVTAGISGNATITVTYTYTLGSSPLTITIPVPVTVHPPVLTTSLSSLTFLSQSLGTTSAPQQITVTSARATGDLVSVPGVRTVGDFSETDNCVAMSPLASAQSCAINVTFTPTAAGSRTGTLSIGNSVNGFPLSLPLTGTGVSCVNNLYGRGTPSGTAPARIDLSWTGISNAASYNVLRGNTSGGPYSFEGNTTITAYSDTNGLTNGNAYYYVLQPLDASGSVVCQSNEAKITIPSQGR